MRRIFIQPDPQPLKDVKEKVRQIEVHARSVEAQAVKAGDRRSGLEKEITELKDSKLSLADEVLVKKAEISGLDKELKKQRTEIANGERKLSLLSEEGLKAQKSLDNIVQAGKDAEKENAAQVALREVEHRTRLQVVLQELDDMKKATDEKKAEKDSSEASLVAIKAEIDRSILKRDNKVKESLELDAAIDFRKMEKERLDVLIKDIPRVQQLMTLAEDKLEELRGLTVAEELKAQGIKKQIEDSEARVNRKIAQNEAIREAVDMKLTKLKKVQAREEIENFIADRIK